MSQNKLKFLLFFLIFNLFFSLYSYGQEKFSNPVIRGGYPDPSITKVGTLSI